MSTKVLPAMENIAIEAKMAMEAVNVPAEAKKEMTGSHFTPLVSLSVAPSEAEERDVENTCSSPRKEKYSKTHTGKYVVPNKR